jgi:hypothetical protein
MHRESENKLWWNSLAYHCNQKNTTTDVVDHLSALQIRGVQLVERTKLKVLWRFLCSKFMNQSSLTATFSRPFDSGIPIPSFYRVNFAFGQSLWHRSESYLTWEIKSSSSATFSIFAVILKIFPKFVVKIIPGGAELWFFRFF